MSAGLRVWLSLLVFVAVGYGAYRYLPVGSETETASATGDADASGTDKENESKVKPGEKPVDLSSFTMTERSGESYNFEQLKGKIWVANTFFASCPHQCRKMNESVAALQNNPDFADVHFVSVSVDPAADTPKDLAEYADTFSADKDRWLFMNGKMSDVRRLGDEMGVATGYQTHTRKLIVFDQTGTYRGAFTYNSQEQMSELSKLLQELLAAQKDSEG